ncbi:MAG: pyridoxamine 5'-phosphate oxidase family protein [Microbacterium sp.]|uniref:pyridoxamine 5'-phosphate oxidase family protein n=1 Tax=Microbacterium sp. TaxID=51671 RepID=UPI0039E5CBBC
MTGARMTDGSGMPTPQAPAGFAADPVQGDVPVADPLALAASWLPGPTDEPLRMTLSTIDADGFPRARTVLLTEFDGRRFFFHTDALSRKVADLAADPRVCLTVLWAEAGRQLVVQGTASSADAEEAAEAYRRRSPYLRQLAWQNTVEYAQLPLAEREAAWAAFRAEAPDPAQPDGWAGFAVEPHRLLFWVAHPDAASRRAEYTRAGAGWALRRLPG